MSDIVKDSETLKQALLDRWDELGLTGHQISADAQKRGLNGVTERALSVWKHHSTAKGALNQYQILWLCYRFGIEVRLRVGTPVIENGKLKHIIEQPYNEDKALKLLYEMFPATKKTKKK